MKKSSKNRKSREQIAFSFIPSVSIEEVLKITKEAFRKKVITEKDVEAAVSAVRKKWYK
jgi:hypothetical protein